MGEAGELVIRGSLDTTDITRGTDKINTSFKDMAANSRTSNSAMNSLFETTSKVAGTVGTIAKIGAGGLLGLAAFAPQTKAAMAQIGASTKQLSLIVGEELSPAWNFAAEGYANFVNKLGDGETILGSTFSLITSIAGSIAGDLGGAFSDISRQMDEFDAMVAGRTGGTTVTQELVSQVDDFTRSFQEEGFIGGIRKEFRETIDAVKFLWDEVIIKGNDFVLREVRNPYNEVDTTGGNVGG